MLISMADAKKDSEQQELARQQEIIDEITEKLKK